MAFLEVAGRLAPLKTRKVESECHPWMKNEIKTLSYHRDYLKKKAVKYNCEILWIIQGLSEQSKPTKSTKAEYFKNNFNKNGKDGSKAINGLVNKRSKSAIIDKIKLST